MNNINMGQDLLFFLFLVVTREGLELFFFLLILFVLTSSSRHGVRGTLASTRGAVDGAKTQGRDEKQMAGRDGIRNEKKYERESRRGGICGLRQGEREYG